MTTPLAIARLFQLGMVGQERVPAVTDASGEFREVCELEVERDEAAAPFLHRSFRGVEVILSLLPRRKMGLERRGALLEISSHDGYLLSAKASGRGDSATGPEASAA